MDNDTNEDGSDGPSGNRYQFNGLSMSLGNLSQLSHARTRSISAENMTGAKGGGAQATEGTGSHAARDLGKGWKVSPSIKIAPWSTATLAYIQEAGAIQHFWISVPPALWRTLILRAYWDDEKSPSIECPFGDFFANGWCELSLVNSLPISVNPAAGLNSYWEMPFRKSARLTLENLSEQEVGVFYQIDYTLTTVPADRAYFHASWRRSNPLPYQQVHTLLDHVRGEGHYVGTYLAWQANTTGWWGEGEVKFYLDGDQEYPTICGTGTEDYFGGAFNFDPGHPAFAEEGSRRQGEYRSYSTPFLGLSQIIRPDGLYRSQQRFGMYRWHIMDPIRFTRDLRVTIQALGWRSGARYLPLQDDIASTSFWYQTEPHTPHPPLPGIDALEVI